MKHFIIIFSLSTLGQFINGHTIMGLLKHAINSNVLGNNNEVGLHKMNHPKKELSASLHHDTLHLVNPSANKIGKPKKVEVASALLESRHGSNKKGKKRMILKNNDYYDQGEYRDSDENVDNNSDYRGEKNVDEDSQEDTTVEETTEVAQDINKNVNNDNKNVDEDSEEETTEVARNINKNENNANENENDDNESESDGNENKNENNENENDGNVNENETDANESENDDNENRNDDSEKENDDTKNETDANENENNDSENEVSANEHVNYINKNVNDDDEDDSNESAYELLSLNPKNDNAYQKPKKASVGYKDDNGNENAINKKKNAKIQETLARFESEMKAGDAADLLGQNPHVEQSHVYIDLGRRFVPQYKYSEVSKETGTEHNGELIPEKAPPELVLVVAKESALLGPDKENDLGDVDQKKILRSGDYWNAFWKEEVSPEAPDLRSAPEKKLLVNKETATEHNGELIPEKAPPELVLVVATESALLGPDKENDLGDVDQKKILRSGDYWNAFWKEEVSPKIPNLRSAPDKKVLGSIKAKIKPGSEFYKVVSRMKKMSPRLLYIINKKQLK